MSTNIAESMDTIKLKILLCIPDFSIGGAEHIVDLLAENFSKKDQIEISVCCIKNIGPLSLQLQKKGYRIYTLKKRNPFDLFTLARAYHLLKEIKPDIVHAFLPTSGIWMSFPSYLARVPVKLYGVRNTSDNLLWWLDTLERFFIIPFIDMITFVSDDSRNSFLRRYNYPKQKSFVIRNGVEFKKFSNARIYNYNDKLIITCVGRLAEQKGIETIINAFSKLILIYPHAKLWVVGDGRLKQELINIANDLAINRSVFFWGQRFDIPKILSQTDIYVSASLWEGIPNAHLEAMASALPIVATKVGGVDEILNDQTAILIPSGNSEILLDSILYIVRNPKLAKSLGHYAQQKVLKEFRLETMVDNYEGLYKKLILEVIRK